METPGVEVSDTFYLTQLCNEPFWNTSRAWEAEVPDFGMCVERTVLVWAPCLFLWVCFPFYVFCLKRKPFDPVPWTAISYTKIMVSVLQLLVWVSEIVWAGLEGLTVLPPADFIAPVVLLITQALHLMLLVLGQRRGECTSGLLWFFWLTMLMCGIPQLYTTVTTTVRGDGKVPPVLVVTFLLQYLSCLALFITNCFSHAPSKLYSLYLTEKPSPELQASFLSRLFFFWSAPLIWRGWQQPLTFKDMWDVVPKNSAARIYNLWRDSSTGGKSSSHLYKMMHNMKKNSLDITFVPQVKQLSILKRLWIMIRGPLICSFILHIMAEGIRFITPIFLSLLIGLITDKTEPVWHGYLYAVGLFLICESATLVKNAFFNIALIQSVRVRSALMSAIYEKALKLSGSARRESTLGQIVNLMAVDAQTIGDAVLQLYGLLFAPFIVLVCLILTWRELGASVLAGLALLLLIIPINSVLVNKSKLIQTETMTFRDKRVKMTSEIVNGIKVLKLYAWEDSFAAKVKEVRNEEMRLLKKLAFLQTINSFVFNVTPYMVALVTFTTYLLVSEDNILDAEKAFVSISLFNIMRFPIIQMPAVISQMIQASVSLARMEKYLFAAELDPLAVCSDPSEYGAVIVHEGQFCWEGDEGKISWRLQDIHFKVDYGQLVAVVGPVGAGKSSLMSALLGEIKKDAGRVIINGSLAYVPQQAWLQNATLRENIIWGQPFNQKRYNEVVKACALQADLDMLPGGDMTEIGEKGINISGGQKQRVALARAAYSDSDIVILDDPLSAVDSHVGRHIFDHVIGPRGILKGKTRILVTHAITFLPHVDYVVVMKDGRMVEKGSYNHLVSSGGDFAQFILQHLNDITDEDGEENLDELCSQLEDVMGEEFLPQQLHNHRSSLSINREREMASRRRSVSETDAEPSRHTIQCPNDSCLMQTENGTKCNSDNISICGSTSTMSKHTTIDGHDFNTLEATDRTLSPVEEGQLLVEDETTETGKIAGHVYLTYGRATGLMYALMPVIFMSLGQASNAGSNIWLSDWTSSNSINSINGTSVSKDVFLAGYGAFGFGQAFFQFFGILVVMLASLRAANVLHHQLIDNVVRLPMSFFDTNPSGRIINRFGKEVNVLDTILPGTLRAYIITLTNVVTTMIVIVGATPIAAGFIVPVMMLYYLIQQVFVTTSRQLKRIESVSKSPIYSHFSETIQGASVIRAFKKQNEFFQESLQRLENNLKSVYINIGVNRWLGTHLETLGNLITFAAAILAVVGRDTISPGIVGLSVSYALNITAVLNWLVRIVSDVEANIVSVERISQYIQLNQEAAWRVEGQVPTVSWPDEGHVSFDSYEARYRPGLQLALKGITCSFKPAEKVGIVGRTGAGKSSLTLALFRIIEAAGGHIDIDDVNIAKIGLHDLRGHISIIPQDPVLFSGTLRLNLDPFGVHDDTDIWHALELANLSHYIHSQPQGLEHTVDEDGSNFSVGQRQLVCLARALLRNSRVLVLDEATAAVDLETDNLIQATIRKQFTNCTVLTIAHRLNTIMDYDRVIVLKEGMIAEFDTPAALLNCPQSIFYGMAKDAGLV